MTPDPTGKRLVRARELFDAALERPAGERPAFLAEECGEDSGLLEFVERLLENEESGDDSFLVPPARSETMEPADVTVEMGSAVPGPRIGTRIGSYELTDFLGEGGMGTVWKAWDSVLERSVAVKFLAERLADSENAHQRFLREARSASKLSHPGIATVFNAGEHEGRVYIVFRFIDGETVSKRAKREPLPVEEALRLAREAAEALDHAHERGVLHRDVTSRNVMTDADGAAVIVDFGLALPEGDTRFTKPGSTLGTVGYMAPEIVQGRSADRRSDLYGLGVVLYEMLTGGLPFEGERVESVLRAVVKDPVEAPSSRRPDLPAGVDPVLLKILAKDPDRRYQTARELTEDLRRLEEGLAPKADVTAAESATQLWTDDADGGPARAKRPGRRWIAGAAVAAIVIAYFIHPPAAAPPIEVAVLPLQNDSENPGASNYMALGIGDALATKLAKVSSLRVTPWITSRGYRPMEPLPPPDIADELGVDRLIVGTFRQIEQRLQIRLSLVEGESGMQTWADEFLGLDTDLIDISERIAVSVAEHLKGSDLSPDERAALGTKPTENIDAYRFYLQGAEFLQNGTRADADLALTFFEKALSLDPNLAEAHVGIGAVYSDRYFYGWEGGYRSLELAETNYRTALLLRPGLWNGQRGLIRVSWEKGDSEEILRIGARAAEAGADDIGALFTRGEALVLGGFGAEAAPMFRRVIELDPANRGGYWFRVLANAWGGRYEETIVAAEDYLRHFPEDPEVLLWLGVAHHSRGEHDLARQAYARSMELFGEDGNQYVYHYAGLLESDTGHPDEAKRIWTRAIDALEPRAATQPDNYRMACLLAALYALADQPEKAAVIRTRPPNGEPMSAEFFVAVGDARNGRPEAVAERLGELCAAGALNPLQLTRTCYALFFPGLDTDPAYESFRRAHQELREDLRSRYAEKIRLHGARA